MNSKELKYPVVSFGKGNVLFFARNEADLIQCKSLGLKNGFYNNLIIIDCAGKKTIVKNAEKIETIGWSIFLNHKIKVKLFFSDEISFIDIDEFKMKILKSLTKDKHFWNSDGEFDKRESFIKNATSHEELIMMLTQGFYNEI